MGLMRLLRSKAQYAAMRDFIRPLLEKLAGQRAKGVDGLFFDAPLVMLFHYSPTGGEGEAAIVATYSMLAAESLGLGSCMIGTTTALGHDKQFRARHAIPDGHEVSLALAIGYPAVEFHRGIDRPLASVREA
jgi:nitroreductase